MLKYLVVGEILLFLVMNKKNKGFTLTETLLTITILVILFALAVPGVFAIKKNLRQMELDDKAEIIYTAVQNRLSELYTSGLSNYYDPFDNGSSIKHLGKTPGDYDASVSGDTMNDNSIYYFTSNDVASLNKLLGDNTIDPSLTGQFVVEYMPYAKYETGEIPQLTVPFVYAVYYTEAKDSSSENCANNYSSSGRYLNLLRLKQNRLKDGARIGYYGGSTPGSGSITKISSINDVTIYSNEEINRAVVKGRIGIGVDETKSTFEFVFKDQHGHSSMYVYDVGIKKLYQVDSDGRNVLARTDVTNAVVIGSNYTFNFVLDDLSNDNTRFKNVFPELNPGDDITLTASIKSDEGTVINDTRSTIGNSIYAYVKPEDKNKYVGYENNTAYISNGRHLRNLDSDSKVIDDYSKALLLNDIDFSENGDFYKKYIDSYIDSYIDVNVVTGSGNVYAKSVPVFKGILNDNLNTLDGNGFTIKELATRSALFSTVNKNLIISNLTLTGEKVYGNNYAGGLINTINNGSNVTVKNCKIYLNSGSDIPTSIDSDDHLEALRWIYANTSGGLVGLNNGHLKIESSFVATNIGLSASDATTGGLVGLNNGTLTIDKAYTDCYLYGNNVGGLIGNNEGTVDISNTYTAGFIGTDGNQNARLAGFVPSKVRNISNSYTVIFKGQLDSNRNIGSFYGIDLNSSFSDLSKYYATVGSYDTLSKAYYSKEGSTTEYTKGSPYNEKSSDLGDAFDSVDSVGKSNPYKLMGISLTSYNNHKLKGMDHYGDWGATFARGSLVYYEQYYGGSYGFDGGNVDLSLTSNMEIIGDGYGVVFKKEDINAGGSFKVDGSIVNFSDSSQFEVVKNGIAYVIYPLSRDKVNPDNAINGFYQKCEIVDEGGTEADKKTFYYNPHFARSVIDSENKPSLPTIVCIRSPRHLNNLSLFYSDYNLGDKVVYNQERKMDFASYNWSVYGKNGTSINVQKPIGENETNAFVGTYNGNSYEINNVNFKTKNGSYVGLFGYNKGTIKNVVVATQYKIGSTSYNVTRTEPVSANQTAYFGVLVGYNEKGAVIDNCATAGYYLAGKDGKIYGYRNSEVYVGGLVGFNVGAITNSAADLPRLSLIMNSATCYAGSFVGYNEGTIDNSYGISMIESNAPDGDTKIAGFAGYNTSVINSSYCATTLTSAGNGSKTYSFAPIEGGGSVKNSYYLNGGSYLYLDNLYSYDGNIAVSVGKNKIYKELADLKGTNVASDSKYHDLTTGLDANETVYPYRAVVKNNEGDLVHYGEWQVKPKLGVAGVFYWEKEVDGQNNGYKITYIGTAYDKLAYSSNLCVEHDDGGRISEYGYGYYYGADENVDNEKITFNNIAYSDKTFNTEVKQELERQMPHIRFFPYTTRTDTGSDYIYLPNDSPNGNITLTLDNQNKSYSFDISPFFANAIYFKTDLSTNETSAQKYLNSNLGKSDNAYEIRSAQQLQYLNWNYVGKNTNTYGTMDNRTQFTYLMYSKNQGINVQSADDSNNTSKYFAFVQSHDINAQNTGNFFPIAGQANSNKYYNSYEVDLANWFGGSYDGQSYKIQEIQIDSNCFTVGLFGVTCGAELKNIILYSSNGATIQRKTTENDKAGAYALGGLAGVAYDYNNPKGYSIYNCSIAGYTIADNSKNQQYVGEANVGSLVGISKIKIDRCSSVVDIQINCTHTKNGSFNKAEWGNYVRVGGISGAGLSDINNSKLGGIFNSYTGGTITVGEDTLDESYYENTKVPIDSNGGIAKKNHSTNIYLAGITGSGFCMNFSNITGVKTIYPSDIEIENCYTYMTFPSMKGTIRSITMFGSVADRYGNGEGKKAYIKNCYYLNRSADFDTSELPKFIVDDGGANTAVNNLMTSDLKNSMLLGSTKWLYVMHRNNYYGDENISNNNTIDSRSYSELSDPTMNALLGDKFKSVTTIDESGVPIDGKYSFSAGNSSLSGKNYPFPTVITQKDDDDTTVNVHYGSWPLESAYFVKGNDTIDIFDDMDLDTYAYKEFVLMKGVSSSNLYNLEFKVKDTTYAELVKIDGTNYFTKDTDGNYHIKVKALKTGSTDIEAKWKNENDVEFTTDFNLVITANLDIEVSPNVIYINKGKADTYKLGYAVDKKYIDVKSTGKKVSYSKDVTWNFVSSKVGADEEYDALDVNKIANEITIKSNGYNGYVAVTATYDYHGNVYTVNTNINVLNSYTIGLHGNNEYEEVYIKDDGSYELSNPSYGDTTGPKNPDSKYFIYERNDENGLNNLIQNIDLNNITLSPLEGASDEIKDIINSNKVQIELSNDINTNSITNNDYNSRAITLTYRGVISPFDCNLTLNLSNNGNEYSLTVPVTVNVIPYTLTLDANGGDFDGKDHISINLAGTDPIELSTYIPTRIGYHFAGWTLNGTDYTSNTYPVTGSNDDVTLVAKWVAKQGYIRFDNNLLDSYNKIEDVLCTYNANKVNIPEFTYDSQILNGFIDNNGNLIIDSTGNVLKKDLFNQYLLENTIDNSKKIVLKASLTDGVKLILQAKGIDSRSILYDKNTMLNAGDSIDLKSIWETDTSYKFAGYINSVSKEWIIDPQGKFLSNVQLDNDIELTAVFYKTGFKKVDSFTNNKEYLIISNDYALSGTRVNDYALKGINIAKQLDSLGNTYIEDNYKDLVWTRDQSNNLYLTADQKLYGNSIWFSTSFTVSSSNQAWNYNNNNLYTGRYTITYVYLDSSNNFTCDNNNYHKNIEIYEKVENIVTDKYQSANTGGGE